jgi:hypothetical protein
MRHLSRSFPLRRVGALALTLALAGACSVTPPALPDHSARAPLLDGYGKTTLHPTQANGEARRLFAQGMAQAYAFNRPEAIRAFKAALAQDPTCAMCAWAVAWQMGPHINNPKRGDLREAVRYVELALRNAHGASGHERALIDSLALRYGHTSSGAAAFPVGGICRSGGAGRGGPADPLDIACAARLRELVAAYPLDPDVLTLYAEAGLMASERDWWNDATGKPGGRVGEVADLLEVALLHAPEHVGLNHYMIHAVDAAPVAARALPAADRLGRLAPQGHRCTRYRAPADRELGRRASRCARHALARPSGGPCFRGKLLAVNRTIVL